MKNKQAIPRESDAHPSVELLRSFVNGRLSEAESLEVETHLEGCKICRDQLKEGDQHTDRFVGALVAAAESPESRTVSMQDASTQNRSSGNTPTTEQETPPIRESIGRFQIRGEIGHGGFGIVLLGYDPNLHREVALKIPRAGSFLSPTMLSRFLREARTAASLDHTGIVPTYEASEADGVCYIASAYCRGPNLAQWLARRNSPVPFHIAADWTCQLARAVAHAHSRGVLHRDLKPSNVLLEVAENAPDHDVVFENIDPASTIPRITDFGLARFLGENQDTTHSNVVMGTAAYMSPEQARGKTREIGVAADTYSLGTILYELLTGRPPFMGETELETIGRVQDEQPIAPVRLRPGIPRDLETICLKCLEKEPHQRFQSAHLLASDLERFLNGEPILARRVPSAERAYRWCCRHPAISSLASAVFLLILVVITGSLVFGVRQRQLMKDAEAARLNVEQARLNEIDQRLKYQRLLEAQHVRQSGELQSDPAIGLLSIAQALELTPKESPRESIHRTRFSSMIKTAGSAHRTWLHQGPVRYATFSHDGRLVVSCSDNGTARVWDPQSGDPVTPPLHHDGSVLWANFHRDGKRLVTAGSRSARIWNITTEASQPIREFKHQSSVQQAEFLPDGKSIVTSDSRSQIRFWDIEGGELIGEHSGGLHFKIDPTQNRMISHLHKDGWAYVWNLSTLKPEYRLKYGSPVTRVAFNCDGTQVAVSSGRKAELWKFPSQTKDNLLRIGEMVHASTLCDLTFNNDGTELMTTDLAGNARLWDTGDLSLKAQLRHSSPVRAAVILSSGLRVTGCGDGTIRIWTQTPRGLVNAPIVRHAGWIHSMVQSPDGQAFLTAGEDQTMRLWIPGDLKWGIPLTQHNGIAYSVAYSSDGKEVLSGGFDHAAFVTNRETGSIRRLEHDDAVVVAEYDRQNRRIITASRDGEIMLWDRLSLDRQVRWNHGSSGTIRAEFNDEGTAVVSTCEDQSVRLWDVETGEELATAQSPDRLNIARFLPKSNRIVTAGYRAFLWDRTKTRLEQPWFECSKTVQVIAFDPVGSRMAVTDGRAAYIHDTETGERLVDGFRHQSVLRSLAWSADGQLLATAGTDRTARIWNANNGTAVTVPMKHIGDVLHVRFSPDDRIVATTTVAGELCLWDSQTGELIAAVYQSDSIWDVDFHPNGSELVTANGRGELIVYQLDIDRRSPERLKKVAEILSGQELIGDSMHVPLDPSEFAHRLARFVGTNDEESILIPPSWHLR